MPRRRSVLSIIGSLLVAGCTGNSGPPVVSDNGDADPLNELGAWPSPRIDSRHTANGGAALADLPSERWRVEFDASTQLSGQLILANGTLYVTDTGNNRLVALDARRGEQSWTYSFGTEPGAGLSVSGDTAYVPTGSTLRAVSLDDRTERWTHECSGAVSPPLPDGSPLLAAAENEVLAFDATTGDVRWRVDTNGVVGSPARSVESVFVAESGGRVRAFDTDSGDERWHVSLAGEAVTAPVLGTESVFVCVNEGNAGRVHRFAQADESSNWRVDLPAPVSGAPAFAGELYVPTQDGGVHAVTHDGAASKLASNSDGDSPASLAVTTESVFRVGGDGACHSFDRGTGDENWRTPEWALANPPTVARACFLAGERTIRAVA